MGRLRDQLQPAAAAGPLPSRGGHCCRCRRRVADGPEQDPHPRRQYYLGPISADHSHSVSGTTAGNNISLDHLHGGGASFGTFTSGGFVNVGSANGLTYGGPAATGAADRTLNHTHTFSAQTGGVSNNHSHTVVGTTADGTNTGTEVRPLSATVLTCIKT